MSAATTASGQVRLDLPGLPAALSHHPRYRVVGELGRGGMGVVYDAIDRQSGETVAIKVLASRRDGLLRFKNEFRLASRLSHPNLIALYDLVIKDDVAFFVMEHAPGVELRRFVRGTNDRADLPRLYRCLAQMLDALECLGASGIVHRDLKPSNVIVSSDGQVKLLDFGLAGAHDTPDFSAAMLAGTPTYMSPEQIAGREIGPPSDLYALGCIVYEMLVGDPPFVGSQRNVLHAQQAKYPTPPSDRTEGVPPELELWCLRLLAKRPEERFPTARAARQALEACGVPATEARSAFGSGPYPACIGLIGRDSERALLDALLDRVREGDSHLALLSGESGIGKTALAESLLAEAAQAGCIVLRGACREHESVAYNAFDAVVDAAASAVERRVARGDLTRAQLAEAADDLALFGKLFPVVRALEAAGPETPEPTNPAGDRERAFAVCKRLIERVTATRPIVLLLDDLHWADEDSLALLSQLLAPPACKGLLVVATAWPIARGAAETPLERFVRAQSDPDGLLSHLTLGPLGDIESAQLVEGAAGATLAPRTIAGIQREAAGNPFLLVELTRLAAEEGIERPTVSEVTRRRLRLLDDDERMLVELAAVSPGPVDADLLHATIGRPRSIESAGLRRLCALKILRASTTRGATLKNVLYDFYHHRIRETVRAEIAEARQRAIHLRLAETLQQLRPDDADSLVRELLLGGEELRASGHAQIAAESAMSRLAHGRAVELYTLALRHAGQADGQRLRVRLGQALEGSARFAEAALHYRGGLDGHLLSGLDRTLVRLRLASCLLHVGQLEDSGGLVEHALSELGHDAERPRLVRALGVLWLLVRLFFAELFQRHPRKSDDARTEARMTAYSLAVPHFQFTSRNLEQLEFALRYRLLGRRSPSPELRQESHAMALILLLPFAHLGRRMERRVARHFARLEANASKQATERGRAWLPLLRALYAMVAGRPDKAIPLFEELADYPFARTGYVALQKHNALFLAGAYDRYVMELTTSREDGSALRPLDIARLAYIERMRGHRETARRIADDIARVSPDDVPWTHRSLYTYQLVELKLLDGDTATAANLARTLIPRVQRSAVSPTTGAYESADAIVRAFLGEARRCKQFGGSDGGERAKQLVREASRVLDQVPVLAPPLFAARLEHDRGLVALAHRRRDQALRHLTAAEALSRDSRVPCFRMRLIEDLLQVLDAGDARRAPLSAEAGVLSAHHRYERRTARAPWIF